MKTLKHTLITVLTYAFLLMAFASMNVNAEGNSETILTVPVTVKEEYSLANSFYEYLNKNRDKTGVDEYVLDEGLTEMAMERATELCIYFNHSSLVSNNTALTDKELSNPLIGTKFSYSAEDILEGTADAESTYKVWYNSNTHRPALISSKYKYCGIGVVTYHNNIKWCLIVSSIPGGKSISGVSGTKETIRNINAKAKFFRRQNITAYDFKKEEDPFYFSDIISGKTSYMLEKAGLFTFKNNTPELFDIDEWGRCQAKATGDGSFTVYYKNNLEICTVNVSSMCFNTQTESETETESNDNPTETPSQSGSINQTEPKDQTENSTPATNPPKQSESKGQTTIPKQTEAKGQTTVPKQTEIKDQTTVPNQTEAPKANPQPLTVKMKNVTYNGKAQKPAVAVYLNGKKLAKKYYSVKYKNNKNVGYGIVTVKGKGKYAKYYATGTFQIKLKKVSLSSVKAGKKKLTAAWKKTGGNHGYQIQYSKAKNFADAKILNVSAGKKSVVLKNLESKKKYYVRIRSYKKVNNKEIWYTGWSKAKSVKIK